MQAIVGRDVGMLKKVLSLLLPHTTLITARFRVQGVGFNKHIPIHAPYNEHEAEGPSI